MTALSPSNTFVLDIGRGVIMATVGTSASSPLADFGEDKWTNLLDEIAAGHCTPFIGAGASSGHLPAAGKLAEAMADEYGYPMEQGRSDLVRVTQYMAVKHSNGDFPKLQLAKFFNLSRSDSAHQLSWKPDGQLYKLYQARKEPNYQDDDNDAHRMLADLNRPIYLTTNYDHSMYNALRSRNRVPTLDFCRWSKDLFEHESSPFEKRKFVPTPENPVVYHLHGHAGKPESIVATEDDYTDFIVNIAKELEEFQVPRNGKARLPLEIRTALSRNMLLFVGYRVADHNLQVVLRTLLSTWEPANRRLNVAVQLRPEPGAASYSDIEHLEKYLQAYYQWSLNIQVFWGDVPTFTSELRTRLKSRGLV